MSPELAGKEVMILLPAPPQAGRLLLKRKARLEVGVSCLSVLERQRICTQCKSHYGPEGLQVRGAVDIVVAFCHTVSVNTCSSRTAHPAFL